MGRRSSTPKEKSRKPVNVKLLSREHAGRVVSVYAVMEALIRQHHEHLAKAKIAIAWRFGWKANSDGRVTLGQAKKGSDLDRELHGYDFVILLNHEAVNGGSLDDKQIRALIDHELCHCQVSKDSNGGDKTDANGRVVYRIRKHDIEEFREIVARHGCWKEELETFVGAALEAKKLPLFDAPAKVESPATLPLGTPAAAAAHTTKPEEAVASKKRGRPRKTAV